MTIFRNEDRAKMEAAKRTHREKKLYEVIPIQNGFMVMSYFKPDHAPVMENAQEKVIAEAASPIYTRIDM